MQARTLYMIAAMAVLAACVPVLNNSVVSRFIESETIVTRADGPPNAREGSCWGRDVTPAVIETVTDRIMLQPAEIAANGQVQRPAVFKTETREQIIRERAEVWFETPCPVLMTPEFVSNLQRALAARQLFRGRVTGEFDAHTRRAVRKYQRGEGLDSPILSLAAARKLGLIALDRDTITRTEG